MFADEIKPGDECFDANGVVYTVITVETQPPHVVAQVQFSDGGSGTRMWENGKEARNMRRGNMRYID